MRSKELCMQVKQATLKLQKQKKKKHLRDSYNRSGHIYSLVHHKRKNAKMNSTIQKDPNIHRRKQRWMIISTVKRNPFTTDNQGNSTLQEVGVSLSKSTKKRRLHESEDRGITARCKSLISLKNRKARSDFAKKTKTKKHLKKPSTVLEQHGQMK